MTDETPNQRKWRELRERQEAKAAEREKAQRRQRRSKRPNWSRIADRIDGYDRDDLGQSPNF